MANPWQWSDSYLSPEPAEARLLLLTEMATRTPMLLVNVKPGVQVVLGLPYTDTHGTAPVVPFSIAAGRKGDVEFVHVQNVYTRNKSRITLARFLARYQEPKQ